MLLRLLCVHESPEDLVKGSDAGGLEYGLRFYISNKHVCWYSVHTEEEGSGLCCSGRQKFYYQLHQSLTDDSGQVINPLNLSSLVYKNDT